ncbi:MAG: hypothetical protein LBB94_07335 [Clostridiales bacterium]|nr:hypothetical protein [Clostridiales bacterium]
MNYHRYFIPLKSDSKGFDLGGKDPLGRCVLEDRGNYGRMSLWVQDLKSNAAYKVVLILSDTGKYTGVTLGSLYVDSKGKGEFKTEFDADGLADGQGLPRFCAVAILAGGSGEILSPLVGYRDSPVLWKNRFILQGSGLHPVSKERETALAQDAGATLGQENNLTPPIEAPTAETVSVGSADKDEDNADGNPLNSADNDRGAVEYADDQDFFGSLSEYPPEETEYPSEETEYPPEETEYPSEETEYPPEKTEYPPETTDRILEKASDDAQSLSEEEQRNADLSEADLDVLSDLDVFSDLNEIFANNIEITPFDCGAPDAQWVRISIKEPVYLPIDYRYIINHPLIVAAYKKYNHLIMGRVINNDKTEYALGVPGVYEPQYVSAAQLMGFTRFKTVAETEGRLRAGDYGYWLTPLHEPDAKQMPRTNN